jgi:hypothetical protein
MIIPLEESIACCTKERKGERNEIMQPNGL